MPAEMKKKNKQKTRQTLMKYVDFYIFQTKLLKSNVKDWFKDESKW